MKKMIVKNWKRIASVLMAVILVVGSVNLSELSVNAGEVDDAPNAVGGLSLNDFSLYQFLTYYQYVIKGNATIGNHTVGSMLIGGEGTIGAFGEGALAPVYIHNLQRSGNYAERYPELKDYYDDKVPAYYGAGSTFQAGGWNEWNSSDKFVDFETVFNRIEGESRNIANSYDVLIDYSGSDFSITGNKDAVTVDKDFIQGKWGNLLTIDFSKISSITITNAAFQELVAIDIHVNNIDDFNKPHNISILGDSVNVSYAYNPVMGTHPSKGEGAVCVTINGATFQGGALKSMTGNKQAGQLLDAPMELLWNFPDAETASVEYLGGHVVAPKAAVTIHGGNFEGGVIANELINTSAEGHMYPYYGIPKNFNERPPEEPEEEESLKINVPINIEKTFGISDFSDANERSSVLQKTYFAVFHDNNGYVQTIRYNQGNDTFSETENKAMYSGEFTFSAEKGGTYYFYLAEVRTDTDHYKICDYRWAIKVEVDDDGNFATTYVKYEPTYEEGSSGKVDITEQDKLSGYDSKNGPLEFVNEKIEVEQPTPGSADFTIGLNKTYDGLTLTNLGDDTAIQTFLNGTKFELIEVDESGQPVDGATATTLNPRWDGSNAVVSRKITIEEGAAKYYRLSETKASDGFVNSNEGYIWEITCVGAGEVSAQYRKVGENSYTSYTAGNSYPTVINARESFSGTISLIKTYDGKDLSDTTLLNGTTFALYDSLSDNAQSIATATPEWKNGRAVVTFTNITTAGTYYIREIKAPSGYAQSTDVYECKISDVNGNYVVGYRLAGTNYGYTSSIICNNAKQTVYIAPVTVEISKTFDNPAGLSVTQMTGLIGETKFTFYTDAATTKVTNDFVLQPDPVNSSGTVSYIYDYTRTLNPGDSYAYYVKETATNTNIYTMDDTVYKIEITVEQPTAGVANETINPIVTCTKVSDGTVGSLSFTNTRIPKAQSPATITFTKVFENLDGVDVSKINGIISATRFTLYDDQNNVVTGFSQSATSGPDANGNVTYTYSLVTSSLDVDKTYYYYLKETNTNQNFYQLNTTPYVVRIVIDADGKPTVSYALSGGSLESLDYKENLEITNKPTPADSPTVLNSPVIEFTKEFECFENYIDGSDIVKATTFTLTCVDDSAPIGFIRLSPEMTEKGATYFYQLDLSGLNADTYTGGKYSIRESGTDSRYTTSNDVLIFEIAVSGDGEATVTFIGGKTINNELKPNDPPSTPQTPPTTPNTPSGGGNNPGPNPPGGGGNNPGPNPPSDESNDSTTQSDTDSATTSLEFSDEASAGQDTSTLSNMTSPQTGEKKLPWTVFGGGMSMIFIAGTVYVFKKKEKIEE